MTPAAGHTDIRHRRRPACHRATAVAPRTSRLARPGAGTERLLRGCPPAGGQLRHVAGARPGPPQNRRPRVTGAGAVALECSAARPTPARRLPEAVRPALRRHTAAALHRGETCHRPSQ